ncbi:hypothetical protein [Treponema zioleckii]|uniref:hypothetical protein n=1 Tax=Treponema zioleckii TaxID=331680 RepID=UPI00168BBF20|nr:hypothetical protein [Treponema zioleckii]
MDAFKNGKLHTNVSAVEFAEKKGVVKISKFTEKNSAFEKSGLKKNDVIKKIAIVDGSGSEFEVKWNELAKIPAGATLSFAVERGNGKKAQSLTINVPVEWNENELKNIR